MTIIFELPLEFFRGVYRDLRSMRVLRGIGARTQETGDGTILSAEAFNRFLHPWFTVPTWNPDLEQWEAVIRPGFCQTRDPLVQVPANDGTEADQKVPLTQGPRIPLNNFRAIGNDENTGAIPAFFEALGVQKNQAKLSVTNGDQLVIAEDTAEVSGRRYLRAADFVLRVARATLVSDVTIVDATGGSGKQVDYSARLDTTIVDAVGTRPRITQEAEFAEERDPTLLERLLGLYAESSEDTHLISTVYLLSPVDGGAGFPDGSWTPYVRHSLFWNLGHAGRNEIQQQPSKPITIFTGLFGGIADELFNELLSPINDITQRLETAINAVSNKGKFWTV